MKQSIFSHIDYGSRGNSGLYILKILNSLNNSFKVEAYVSQYFPFNTDKTIHKIFDKFSHLTPNNFIRNIYKLIDLYVCLTYIAFRVLIQSINRKVFLCVSIYAPFLAYKQFICLVKLSKNVRIILTIHDAETLDNNYPSLIMCKQEEIIGLADSLVVHTAESKTKLNNNKIPIFLYPFPLMDLKENFNVFSRHDRLQRKSFLFIGYLRKEKGLQVLLDSWRKVQDVNPFAKLVIAGAVPFGLSYDFSELKNVELKLDFLSDDEYRDLINDCDFVVLPYISGTNSGVLSTVTSLHKPVITSDLPMFKDSSFIISDLIFKSGDSLELSKLILKLIENEIDYNELIAKIKRNLTDFDNFFQSELNKVYQGISDLN